VLTGSTIGPEASVNGYVVLAIAFVVVAALCKPTIDWDASRDDFRGMG